MVNFNESTARGDTGVRMALVALVAVLAATAAVALLGQSDCSDATHSGETGDCTWTLSDDGELEIYLLGKTGSSSI